MVQILIVEDEPSMQLGLKDNLEFEGYKVTVTGDGKSGLEMIRQSEFDLVLLDIMLPELSGLDVCRKLRSEGNQTPIILLTAKGEEIDKVLGLELGADDYVTKPFSLRELLARIKALLRRSASAQGGPETEIRLGDLTVNFHNYTAYNMAGEVKMSHKEFEILHFLYENRNLPVSRYKLLEEVWGYNEQPTTRTVDNFILRLRQRIEKDPGDPRIILTVHGSGYKMIMP